MTHQIKYELLQQIQKLSGIIQNKSSPFELQNIKRDVSYFCSRIESGEYENTDFLNRQTFDAQRRIREFFNYLKGYYRHAVLWTELLKKVPIKNIETTIDLCPGYSPKIQWALEMAGYKGSHYIIDKSTEICEQLATMMKVINATYDYFFVNDSIYHSNLSNTADLITGNHIFDDLCLDLYCSQQSIPLDSIYEDEHLLRDATESIPSMIDINQFCSRFFSSIHDKLKPNGYLMMTHYTGITESALSLIDWSSWVKNLMNRTSEFFIDNQYILIEMHISENDNSGFYILQRP